MADVIDFSERKQHIEENSIVLNDLKKEIEERNDYLDSTYKYGDSVHMEKWNGEMWQIWFENKITSIANEIDENPWDVFSVLLPKFIKNIPDWKGE